MKRIMFIESGSTGYGGSFQSLFQTINNLNQKKYNFVVIFFNKTYFYDELIKKGTECYYINDLLFSTNYSFWKKISWKLDSAIFKSLPFMSLYVEYLLHIFTIYKIKSLAKKKKVDIIHLVYLLMIMYFHLSFESLMNLNL